MKLEKNKYKICIRSLCIYGKKKLCFPMKTINIFVILSEQKIINQNKSSIKFMNMDKAYHLNYN